MSTHANHTSDEAVTLDRYRALGIVDERNRAAVSAFRGS